MASKGQSSSGNVRVYVRVRPFNGREQKAKIVNIVDMKQDTTILTHPEGRKRAQEFLYDDCFYSLSDPPGHENFAAQKDVYEKAARQLLDSAFLGYNAWYLLLIRSLFAYGQTGSGKTFSMMGDMNSKELMGCIPRLVLELFERIREKKVKEPGALYKVEAGYIEIYNEKVMDLLVPPGASKEACRVRQHPTTGPFVEGQLHHPVANLNQVLTLMERGNAARATAATNMNERSSRSHAIFTLQFSQTALQVTAAMADGKVKTKKKVSKIHLVDLAGSERVKLSGVSGDQFDEAKNINLSLTTLGRVIDALAEASKTGKKPKYLPYRDSALTWLLSTSIGGNSKTVMIATVSPSPLNYDETKLTLLFAARAKCVIQEAVVNEDTEIKMMEELQAEISALQEEMKSKYGEALAESEQAQAELQDKLRFNERLLDDLQQRAEASRLELEKELKQQQMSTAKEAAERDKLAKEYESLNQQHSKIMRLHESKEKEIVDLYAEIEGKQREWQERERKLKAAISEKEKMVKMLEKEKESYGKLSKEQQAEMNRLNDKLMRMCSERDDARNRHTSQAEEIEREKKKFLQLQEEQQEELQKMNSKLKKIAAERDDARDTHARQVQELEEEKDKLTRVSRDQQEEMERLNRKLQGIMNERDSAKENNSRQAEEIEREKQKFLQLQEEQQEELKKMNSKLKKIAAERDDARDTHARQVFLSGPVSRSKDSLERTVPTRNHT